MVTVVGDGVADLPALAEADLAVAQPSSTQAALGLADIVLLGDSPVVLLRVLRRGQAIVRGLLDVLKLNLTMVVASALLIVAVRALSVGFPYGAAQGAIVSILVTTIPSLALGLWARGSGAITRTSYSWILVRFVVPAGVGLSVAAVCVYLYFVDAPGGVPHAQLAVSYTLLYAGLVAVVLMRREWRFAALAGALAAVATLLPAFPAAARQFRLDWLQPTDYLVVAVAVAAWLGGLLLVRRLIPRRPSGT